MIIRKKRLLLLQVICLLPVYLTAQPPAGYYDSAAGLTGKALQQALHDIIDNHTVKSYSDLWTCFYRTDVRSDSTTIWDMYSDIPGGTPAYTYTKSTDQCGNYGSEGDCYNREHSFPKSWFNDLSPMYSDLFHIYATDGYVNGKRSNFPFGEVGIADWTSSNGSKLGTCSWPGYSGTVFEPIDAYKGDFARTYFYMATRYYKEDSSWPGSDMVTGSQPKEWALTMLLEWHRNDPVSSKETARNNAVYKFQKNRNPFIDNPDLAEKIWGTLNYSGEIKYDYTPELYPNPTSGYLNIRLPDPSCQGSEISVYDYAGCLVREEIITGDVSVMEVSDLAQGIYFIRVRCPGKTVTGTFIIAGKK